MDHSESLGALAASLAKAQGQMQSAKKDTDNQFYESKYADIAAIVDAIKTPLSSNGLAYVQTTDIDEGGAVIVETTLIHSSGEWISGRLKMKPAKDNPQGVGSAITYARRYGLQAIVGLDADDDDGNAASGNKTEETSPKAEAPSMPPATNNNGQPAGGKPEAPTAGGSITSKQIQYAYQIGTKQLEWTEEEVDSQVRAWFKKSINELNKAEASKLIDDLLREAKGS